MTRISTRIWAGVLAMFLLPVLAAASDKDDGSNNHAGAGTASAAGGSAAPTASPTSAAPAAGIGAASDPLLRLMVVQGLISAEDVKKFEGMPSSELRDRLLVLLLMKNKSALSAEDLNALKATTAGGAPDAAGSTASAVGTVAEEQPVGPPKPPPAPTGGVIPAVAPIRVLQIDPPKREGVIPTISVGKNVRIQPYGFVKVSGIYDTSSPYGNDFPLPGFNPVTNGPDSLSEFHLKTRSTRLGSNFEWLDISPNVVVTGRVEVDFEGNFERANNRNISSIRSSMPSIRLAYGRVDWHTSDNTSIYLLGGQDWTIFGNSTLPNLFETTGLGIGFGTLYQRLPQIRFGVNHNFGAWSLEPDVAIVLPSYGNLPADLTTVVTTPTGETAVPTPNNLGVANQLGYGERQGVDSARPEVQARLVGQFQLDHAPGVAPAQIIVSGVNGERSVFSLSNQVPLVPQVGAAPPPANSFQLAFPAGARVSSNRYAWTGEVQLPTRWFTLIGKYYNGSDLRFYFAGQIFAEFNDTTGLLHTATGQNIDGSSTLVYGFRNGVPVVANQLPPRAQGGFVNLGIPLSRLAHADPNGRNAGWVVYAHYGYDQVLARDVRRLGGGRMKGDLFAGTLQYRLNNFVSFIAEESLYRTRAIRLTTPPFPFPSFAGRPMREWKDFRSEFGPIFTF